MPILPVYTGLCKHTDVYSNVNLRLNKIVTLHKCAKGLYVDQIDVGNPRIKLPVTYVH